MIEPTNQPKQDADGTAPPASAEGAFCFSTSTAPGVPLVPGCRGFNSEPVAKASPTTGRWARSK
jgi:hypothetical protein